jgi:hypothetical protein
MLDRDRIRELSGQAGAPWLDASFALYGIGQAATREDFERQGGVRGFNRAYRTLRTCLYLRKPAGSVYLENHVAGLIRLTEDGRLFTLPEHREMRRKILELKRDEKPLAPSQGGL